MSVRDWKGTAKMTVKKLGEIIGTTGDTGGTATAGTLMAKVNAVKKAVESMETSLTGELTANVVKSVQRGVVTYGKNSNYLTSSHVEGGTRTFYKDITISSVNTSKCQVILHVNGTKNYSYTFVNSTKLRIYLGSDSDNTTAIYNNGITYEIVEFY